MENAEAIEEPVEELDAPVVEQPPETDTGEQEADAEPREPRPPENPERERQGLLAALEAERAKRREYQSFLEEMRAQERATPKPDDAPTRPDGEPRIEEYQSWDQYQAAVRAYDRQQVLSEIEQRQQAQAQAYRQQQALRGFQARVDAADDRPEDYSVKIASMFSDPSLPVSPAMAEVILEDDAGPDLAYHLSANPAELRRIAGLTPARQVAALGRLAERLSSGQMRVSSAPPPVKPVKSSTSAASKDPDKMSMSEWVQWRRAQLKSRR